MFSFRFPLSVRGIGGFLATAGVLSCVLRLVGLNFRFLLWIDAWGSAVGWLLRLGLVVIGAAMVVGATVLKRGPGQAQGAQLAAPGDPAVAPGWPAAPGNFPGQPQAMPGYPPPGYPMPGSFVPQPGFGPPPGFAAGPPPGYPAPPQGSPAQFAPDQYQAPAEPPAPPAYASAPVQTSAPPAYAPPPAAPPPAAQLPHPPAPEPAPARQAAAPQAPPQQTRTPSGPPVIPPTQRSAKAAPPPPGAPKPAAPRRAPPRPTVFGVGAIAQKPAAPRPHAGEIDPHEAVTRIARDMAPDPHEAVTRIARPSDAVTTIGNAPEPPEDRGAPTQIMQTQGGDDFGDGDMDAGATQIAAPPQMMAGDTAPTRVPPR
jgi:hypothetical protein